LSSHAELLIYLGVMAALWISYVVRKVRRERRNSTAFSGHAHAYEGNLVIPPGNGRHHGHHGHGAGVGGHGGIGGHGGHGGGLGGHGIGIGGHDAGGGHH
jgi:hypothetical protein